MPEPQQQQVGIDPGAVLNQLQQIAGRSEVVQLALESAIKGAAAEQLQAQLAESENLVAAQAKELAEMRDAGKPKP